MRREVRGVLAGLMLLAMLGAAVRVAEAIGMGLGGESAWVMIPRGEEMKELSTDIDGAEWKTATPLKLEVSGQAKVAEGMGTQAKVFYGEKNLYVGWQCGETDMEHLVTKGLSPWECDSVELFIEPREDLVGKPYHHVVVTVAGETLFERGHVYPRYYQLRAFEERWEPKAEVKVEKGKTGWVVVMRVPLADLHIGEEANKGGLWRINFCRSRPARDVKDVGKTEIYWSWADLKGPFQSPARFGYAGLSGWGKAGIAEQAMARVEAAARPDASVASAADGAVMSNMDHLIAGYWDKPERLKEIEAVAYLGDASYAMVKKKVEAAITAREHYAAARDLLYLLERDRPDLDPPPAEVTDRVNRFEFHTQKDEAGQLSYRLFKPTMKTGEKYPLMIFLHGSAERGNDNERQLFGGVMGYALDAVQTKHPCFVMAPQCPLTSGWADLRGNPDSLPALKVTGNYRIAEKPGETTVLLLEAIDAVVAANPAIDRDRIYVGGASLGGFGTWELLMRRPTFFAAAVVLCGSGDETKAGTIKDVPIWDFHGALDLNVKPEASRTMRAAMEKIGGKAKFTEFPDRGHRVGEPNLEAETLEWMFAQRKDN